MRQITPDVEKHSPDPKIPPIGKGLLRVGEDKPERESLEHIAAEFETVGLYVDADSDTIPSLYLSEDKDALVLTLLSPAHIPNQGFHGPSLLRYSGHFSAGAYIDTFINEESRGEAPECPMLILGQLHACPEQPDTGPQGDTTYKRVSAHYFNSSSLMGGPLQITAPGHAKQPATACLFPSHSGKFESETIPQDDAHYAGSFSASCQSPNEMSTKPRRIMSIFKSKVWGQ
ncbi:hypothetical protein HOY80DRAFT_1133803 [Tuber brumale]|nr:hypothetical protein HOY80DRAFT_1133803 [Tuber brumale]